jgi:uncharacterized protein (TIGR02996 family)
MTDEPGFLAAIIADPDDDAPRLQYSDWLDDPEKAGPLYDPKRAEFIRVQCALARRPHFGPRDSDPRYCWPEPWEGRRRREGKLWEPVREGAIRPTLPATFPGEWSIVLAGTPVVEDAKHAVLRRGFVEAVTCAAADWLRHGDAVLAAQPVCKVHFSDAGFAVERKKSPVEVFRFTSLEMARRFLDGSLAEYLTRQIAENILGVGSVSHVDIFGDGIPPAPPTDDFELTPQQVYERYSAGRLD